MSKQYTVQIERTETFYIRIDDAASERDAEERARQVLNDDPEDGAQWSNDIDTSVVDSWEEYEE